MSKTTHPWRSRSREFANHLAALPTAEQQQIREAEKQFLLKQGQAFGRNDALAREFARSMVGACEHAHLTSS